MQSQHILVIRFFSHYLLMQNVMFSLFPLALNHIHSTELSQSWFNCKGRWASFDHYELKTLMIEWVPFATSRHNHMSVPQVSDSQRVSHRVTIKTVEVH